MKGEEVIAGLDKASARSEDGSLAAIGVDLKCDSFGGSDCGLLRNIVDQ